MQANSSVLLPRRRFIQTAASVAGFAVLPVAYSAQVFAAEQRVIAGPKVADIAPIKLAEQVYCIVSPWGFPSVENQGMMSNVTFVTTQKGVVVIDSGASRQIGEMALRQIRQITPSPIAAVINTHYHGDHWLGNHAFVNENPDVPIYAHEKTLSAIKTGQGQFWTNLMERSTDNATMGTVATPPNKVVAHGDVLDFGDTKIKVHFYGTAHTPSDISLELVGRNIVHVGDVAMDNRIAFMDDGSFRGTFKNYDALVAAVPGAFWIPAHGNPGKQVLAHNRELFEGIYQSAEKAVQDMSGQEGAKAYALADPRVKKYAPVTKGFDENIGKYSSLAYLEAESASF